MAHRLRLLAFLAAVSAIAMQLPANRAQSAEPASQDAAIPGPSHETPSALDTVTVQVRRDREIQRQITKFVSGGVVTYSNDSLERWNQPICPLVVGLPSEPAEFIRARVSEVARDSHAPLGAEHCKPNLFVVITNDPDLLIEKWNKRSGGLFNTCNGLGPVKKFLHSRQPVRVFYNAKFTTAGGLDVGAGVGALDTEFHLHRRLSGYAGRRHIIAPWGCASTDIGNHRRGRQADPRDQHGAACRLHRDDWTCTDPRASRYGHSTQYPASISRI